MTSSFNEKSSTEMKASIEHLERGNGAIIDPEQDGTVQLVADGQATTLVPAPSADPHGKSRVRRFLVLKATRPSCHFAFSEFD